MNDSIKRCEFCHSIESPDNPIDFRRINAGKWVAICRKCAELRESNGKMAEKGEFLSEVEPKSGPVGGSVYL